MMRCKQFPIPPKPKPKPILPGTDLELQHIANALKHELYHQISSSIVEIVNVYKTFEDMNELLVAIQNKTHIHQNELNYIHQLIERAKLFHHSKPSNSIKRHNYHISRGCIIKRTVLWNDDIDAQCEGFTFNLLLDIYNTHKCFLFANYHLQHYSIAEYQKAIKK
eukprot:290916_1